MMNQMECEFNERSSVYIILKTNDIHNFRTKSIFNSEMGEGNK